MCTVGESVIFNAQGRHRRPGRRKHGRSLPVVNVHQDYAMIFSPESQLKVVCKVQEIVDSNRGLSFIRVALHQVR
jgi:hypothetical protein